jgi:hypothetical protein
MKPNASLAITVIFATALAGCVVVPQRSRGRRASTVQRCHPSQYWDGHTCRHKGRGHGARKHDGGRHHR